MVHAISHSTLTTSQTVQRKRLLVLRDHAFQPFAWRGLLPTLGLMALTAYAVWPFARGGIEANVQRSISQAFMDQGMPEVKVNVSGQHVLLTGKLKPGVNTLETLKLARSATCPTWLGPQVCAELVIGNFDSLPSMPSLPDMPKLPSLPDLGTAPTPAEKESCEKNLVAAVDKRRIEFASGSAQLLANSAQILDAVAEAHAQCKGVVRVEGHTDNLGDGDLNAKLSLARAQDVRQKLIKSGLPEDRLVAEGFGANRPIADNASRDGRQTNRRIEFNVVLPN